MSSVKDRLELCRAVLALIAEKRAESGDDRLGACIESAALEGELRELEAEILDNPGPLETCLVRRRTGAAWSARNGV